MLTRNVKHEQIRQQITPHKNGQREIIQHFHQNIGAVAPLPAQIDPRPFLEAMHGQSARNDQKHLHRK